MIIPSLGTVRTEDGLDSDGALACFNILWFMNVALWEQKEHFGRS